MKLFEVYDKQTAAPEASKQLARIDDTVGFIPNIFAVIAKSVPGISAFVEMNIQFGESTFNATERAIIQATVSVENQCTYCVAGHTAFAAMQEVDPRIVEAIRNQQDIADTKLQALRTFTHRLTSSKGTVPSSALNDFLAAGYQPVQVIEVILGIAVKTFSNLTNNTIGVPLDDIFKPYAWHPEQQDNTESRKRQHG